MTKSIQFPLAALTLVGVLSVSSAGQTAQSCQSHIPSTWEGNIRAAAEADCAFNDESQKIGAQAWWNFADENFATKSSPGRDALRDALKENYAKPGFKLYWWPTQAQQFGNLVVTSGSADWHIPDGKGGETIRHTKYLTVWRQHNDGSWRFIWDGSAS